MRSQHVLTHCQCGVWTMVFAVGVAAVAQGSDHVSGEEELDTPCYPVVLRLGDEALDSLIPSSVNHRGRVDDVILGTRCLGNSHTTGTVEIRREAPGSNDLLRIEFTGKIRTVTVGHNGPARIDSQSETTFQCTREIRYDPEKGFVASPCQVQSNTNLHYIGFRSARGGPGSRFVGRIAERRAMASKGEATQIVAGRHRGQLVAEFDERLDEAVASLNRRITLLRYAGLLLPERNRLQIAVASSDDSLQIGIGPADEDADLPSLPPFEVGGAPMELWLHASLIGKPTTRLKQAVSLASITTNQWLAPTSESPLWFVSTAGETLPETVRQVALPSGWFRIGLGDREAAAEAESKQQPDGEGPVAMADSRLQ